jgi:hypothetical protein
MWDGPADFRRIPCRLCGDSNVVEAIDKNGCEICVAVFKLLIPDIHLEREPL